MGRSRPSMAGGLALAEERLCEWCRAPLPPGWRYLICDFCRRSALALIREEAERAGRPGPRDGAGVGRWAGIWRIASPGRSEGR